MGSTFSTDEDRSVNSNNPHMAAAPQPLNALLLQDSPVQWDLVRQSLRWLPDQACLYAHHVEASPLHVALSKGCPVDVAQTLIDSYQDALDHPSGRGMTVLHAAASCGSNDNDNNDNDDDETAKVIRLLLSKRRSMARMADKDGLLPLHYCRTSVGGTRALIETFPQGAQRRCRFTGSLPLHYALMEEEPNPNVCRLLVQYGRPMHSNSLRGALSSSSSSSSSTQSSTLPAGGILTRNKRGETPLSLLIRHLDESTGGSISGASVVGSDDIDEEEEEDDDNDHVLQPTNELWEMLLSEWLPVLMEYDSSAVSSVSTTASPIPSKSSCNDRKDNPNKTGTRKLELHILVENGCCHSKVLMDLVLDHFRYQAMERDHLGRTPLHIAAEVGCTEEALESLIRANPIAPRMADNEGRLPIDWAAESPFIPPKNLTLLIKGEPRAIDTRDMRDGRYPFLSAAMVEHTNVNNTYYLLRAKPHVLSYFHLP